VGVILDTSVLVAGERGTLQIEALLRFLGSEVVGISAITASELLLGAHRAGDPALRARRLAYADAMLERLPVLPFGTAEARRHAEIWAHLCAANTMIGPHALLVGATALSHGALLATLHQREFALVPGVRLVELSRFTSPPPAASA
jgi:tRNA(fMet)-specific endonuclease VapC